MSMTLTFKEFALVFIKPRAIILGEILQFGLMPFLAMTIALLLQDAMGDFYSSMFVTSGLFGLVMYLAGVISIFLYKPLLPVTNKSRALIL
jgi:predicted Na+-dependent transporter